MGDEIVDNPVTPAAPEVAPAATTTPVVTAPVDASASAEVGIVAKMFGEKRWLYWIAGAFVLGAIGLAIWKFVL